MNKYDKTETDLQIQRTNPVATRGERGGKRVKIGVGD